MTDSNAPSPSSDDSLQFDRVEGAATPVGMTCASCGKPIVSMYYDVNGKHICADCRARIEAAFEPSRGPAPFVKALLFGGAASLLGAGIYYGIAAVLHLEIGLIAILIGWMVGAAIRKATGGIGGRRYQVLAVVLTYFSMGLAYSSLTLGNDSNLIARFLMSFALPVIVVGGSLPGGLISGAIIGFGMVQAWRMTAGGMAAITGPYRVGGG